MKKSIFTAMAVMMILMMAQPSWAEPKDGRMMGRGPHRGMDCGPMFLFDKLDLTQQQMDKLDKILDQHKDDFKTLHKKIKEDRKNLQETINADTYSEQKIRASAKALAANMEEMAVLRGKLVSEIRAILSPEQVEQLKQMRSRHQEQMKLREKFKDMMLNDSPGDHVPGLFPG